MNALIARVAGSRYPESNGYVRASRFLFILPLLAPFTHAQIPTTSITVSVDASDCCNLSAEAIDPLGPDGPWWNDPDYVRATHITPEQQQQLDAVYNPRAAAIYDLRQHYVQEKATLKTMLSAASPEESAIDSQISRIEQARTSATKAITLSKLAIRRQLSDDQWKQVQKIQKKKSK